MAWTDETIRTERLRLRAVHDRDRPAVVTYLTDPRAREFLGGPVELPPDFESLPLGQQPGVWGIQPDGSDTIVGTVSITDRRDRPEISYSLIPSAWRNGYATEACGAVLDWVWDTTTENQVIAVTQVANTRSLALLVRLGFTESERFMEFDAEQSLQTIDRPPRGGRGDTG